jgi:predicted metal-dependent hydrolase
MHAEPSIQRPPGVHVTYRKMKFDFEDQGFDRYWHGGSAFKSLFWSQLSTAFAPGEQFFIDSARALRSFVTDPVLLNEVAEFCRQEGHHTAQHLKFDRVNESLGVDVAGCRKVYERILQRSRSKLSPIHMLAVTCALEHFTAGFADQFFADPRFSDGADPKVYALWAWHAAEEAEHRATCFDIYQQSGGTYAMRVASLVGAWSIILGAAVFNTAYLLRKDKRLFTRDTLSGLNYLFGPRGIVIGLLPAFFAYWKPGFHPWKGVSAAPIDRWRAENQRFIQGSATV